MSSHNGNRSGPLHGLCSALRKSGLDLTSHWLRWIFPDVPRTTTAHLAEWLASLNRSAPLLLDVRSRAEYETSFIGGARWADPTREASLIPALKAELAASPRPVIVYCSAGYRSARFARQLLAAGITPVYNLEGSIFAWANEGRALQNPRGATQWVHPYNALFGLLLDKAHRAARKSSARQ